MEMNKKNKYKKMNSGKEVVSVHLGRSIYQKNTFLGHVAEFMEHPSSKEFYEKYLHKDRIHSAMFFL